MRYHMKILPIFRLIAGVRDGYSPPSFYRKGFFLIIEKIGQTKKKRLSLIMTADYLFIIQEDSN